MKSMCHEARRNSPSVAERSPTSSCIRTASRIASSSILRSSAASIRPAPRLSRASRSRARPQQAADVLGPERRPRPFRVGVWVVSCCTGGTLTKRRLPPSCEDESNARKGAMMAAVESEVLEGRQFIAGEWVASAGGETFDDLDPFTGDVVGQIAAGTREDAQKAVEAAAAAFPEWSTAPPAATAAGLPQGGRRSREQGRRGRLAARARDRRHLRLRHVPAPLRGRAVPPGGRNRVRADGRDHPLGHRRVRDGDSPPGRRRRRDRALERGADPLRALDHRTARPRQHGRAQAFRALAVRRRAAVGRDLRRGGTPAGSPQHRHARSRRGGPDRRRAGREPARARHQLHRLDEDRPKPRRGRGAQPEAASCSSSAATTR